MDLVETSLKFKKFTDKQIKVLKKLEKESDNKVLVSKFNISLKGSDIKTLCNNNLVNDQIINFYMNLLMERSEQGNLYPTVYAMNTFFIKQYLKGGYMAVRRWTRKLDIFTKDIIAVPVYRNDSKHWSMAIINLKKETITYYDSLGVSSRCIVSALERYLRAESLNKRKIPFDTSKFELKSKSYTPLQSNVSDCGVFCCMIAEYITREKCLTFSQENMPYFRKKMILEIMSGKLFQ